MKKILLVFLLLSGFFAEAQPSINNYQYVIVPSRFGFQRSKDEFRLNTLTKLLFEKYGFKAYLDNEQPAELADSNCNKLFANIDSDGGMLTTRVRIVLKDCKNKVLYTSDEGKSREKDWATAYNFAIREAFQSFTELRYKYNGGRQTAAASQQSANQAMTLFAQPIANGFQLVDATPKVVMKIFKTSSTDRFTAVKDNLNGELTLKSGQWFFEYYKNDQLVSELVDVKF